MEEDRLEMAYQSSGVKMDITNYVKTKLGVGSEEDQKEQTSPRDEDDIEQQACAFFPFPNLDTHFFKSLWCVKFEKDP